MRTTATRGAEPLVQALRRRGVTATARGGFLTERGRYLTLAGFLVAAFLLGGGARGDIASLVILRPLAVLACGYALLTLDRATIAANRGLLGWFAAVVLFVALSLVPLPPGLWQALPGRAPLAAVDAAVGNAGMWRPFTLVPDAGLNALFSLTVPAAVLLLGIQLPREQLARLLPLVLGLCIASGLLGLIQVIGPERGPLYFYRITNTGAAVGLFSNRNHAAVFLACLAPLAVTWLLQQPGDRRRMGLALAAVAVLTPLALAGGSRAGLITGVLALAGAGALLWRGGGFAGPQRRMLLRGLLAAGAVLVVLVAAFVYFARVASVDRLLDEGQAADLRFQAWPVVLNSGWDYFPWGSGIGSFVEVYQIVEPLALLSPSYFNHAHNDLLELFVTTGVPGLALLAVAAGAIAVHSLRAWLAPPVSRRSATEQVRADRALARMATILFAVLAIASLVDYPLRTPSLAALAVLLYLWLRPARADAAVDSGGEADNASPGAPLAD